MLLPPGLLRRRVPACDAAEDNYSWQTVESEAPCRLPCTIETRYDLAVHVHNLPDFLVLAGLVPRLAGRKVVLDVHDSIPETFATKFSGSSTLWKVLCLEERLSTLLAHRVICVNDPQRDTLVGRGISASKTFVSMNVPDPAIFKSNGAADRSVAAADCGRSVPP